MSQLNGQHHNGFHGPIPPPVAGVVSSNGVSAKVPTDTAPSGQAGHSGATGQHVQAQGVCVDCSLIELVARMRCELMIEQDRRTRVMALVSQLAGHLDQMKAERRSPSDILAITKLSEIAHQALSVS